MATTEIHMLAPEQEIGSVDKRYILEKPIGRGRMAAVWKAEDLHESKITARKTYKALKILHEDLHTPENIELFETETINAGKLSHPFIVNLYGLVRDPEGWIFIVMEYLRGKSLRDLLKQKETFTLSDIIDYLRPVAEGLDYAHSERVYHRDLKPENLFVCDDGEGVKVKILDFGLSKQIQESCLDLMEEKIKPSGTRLYMAPETFVHHKPKANQDIHAFACVIYEMLQGTPPFSLEKVDNRRISDDDLVPQPKELNDEAWKILQSGFAYQPEKRPSTATELVSKIEQAQSEQKKNNGILSKLFLLVLGLAIVSIVTISIFNQDLISNLLANISPAPVEPDTPVSPVQQVPVEPNPITPPVTPTPQGKYTDNHDGTITDNEEHLMWKKCTEGQIYSDENNDCKGNALPYLGDRGKKLAFQANSNEFANHTGWTVPSIAQLKSLVHCDNGTAQNIAWNKGCGNKSKKGATAAINTVMFPNTEKYTYWSKDWKRIGQSKKLQRINFFDGTWGTTAYNNAKYFRLVRPVGDNE